MRKWIVGLVIVVILLILGGVGWVYQYGGLRYYLRATGYINKLTGEEKAKVSKDFYVDKERFYSGTLAGTWDNRVWVWGKEGLRYFNVDEYSVYSYTDGCSGTGPRTIQKEVIVDYDDWSQKAKSGDYVVVLIAGEANGGTLGNLREVFTYNWWVFMGKDMKTECAK